MISDQSCPLCGEKMNLFKGTVICSNKKCGLRDVISIDSLKDMESQIARIKQEAKQEFANDLDSNSTNVSDHSGNSIRRYIEFKESVYKKIKKKHGVE